VIRAEHSHLIFCASVALEFPVLRTLGWDVNTIADIPTLLWKADSWVTVDPVRNGARIRGTVQSWSITGYSYIHQQIKLRIISNGRRSAGQNQKSARRGMPGCNINRAGFFTALHCMNAELAIVNPSVRLSVCQTRELWQNEWNFCPNSYTFWWLMHLVFPQEERLVGTTLSTWNLGKIDPPASKTPTSDRYSLLTPQP